MLFANLDPISATFKGFNPMGQNAPSGAHSLIIARFAIATSFRILVPDKPIE